MKGLKLSSLTGELYKVHPRYEKKPVNAIRNIDRKLGLMGKEVLQFYGDGDTSSFNADYCRLPRKALVGFSFDELCKMRYSSIFSMHDTVSNLFKTKARYEVIRKITSSMWRWGYSTGTWNEIVDAYENIRHFTFTDDSNFEIRLDYTTGYNEFGYSKFSRLFIDGVFAFLVYYKKKHVLTIGFSIMEGKELLIQQVQSAKGTGNRSLYRLPPNRLEFVIDLFCKNFPQYKLHLIDGESLVRKTLSDYREVLSQTQKYSKRLQKEMKASTSVNTDLARSLRNAEEEVTELGRRISRLELDERRIASFYQNTGRFKLGPTKKVLNNLVHYRITS